MVYLTFKKAAASPTDARGVVAVDVNENNVAVKVDDKVYIMEHNIGRIIIGYSAYRQIAQAARGNRHVSKAIPETKSKKKDRRRKIAKLIVGEAKRSCAIAVEKLPRNAPLHMIERIEDKR